jgi:outer membrane protein OmpA-like peptidoglycan-associated protein
MHSRSLRNLLLATTPLVMATCLNSAVGQERTDLTGQEFTADQLVEALNIPVRGIKANCTEAQQKMTQLTRGISSTPRTAAEVPALKPMKTASVTATFALGSDQLTAAAMGRLKTVAEAMQSVDLQNQCFQVAGHTCDLGDGDYNMELSRRRAEAVKEYLVSLGVEDSRLVTTGFGETSPLTPNESETNRQKNRRVDLGALPPR